ncbi:hypothetical protein GCM10009789_57380 [Kribbella sancticallisti]|uniref:Uncharacterized protein n=1 Tax=Kribbella sancticallisti TaxID=460087 RepID=A0ABN2E478_9ACTN
MAGPLTAVEYQKTLTQLDQRLAGGIGTLGRVKTEDSLSAAIDNLAQTLNAESTAVGGLKPPKRAVAANRVLQLRLKAAATTLTGTGTDDVGCGGLAYVSQAVQRQLTANLAVAVTQLKTLGLRFGSTLPDLGPEPADVRPSNGDIVVRTGSGGSGRLRVKNGTSRDVAVSVVSTGQAPSKPHVMMYVQAKKTATMNRIGGAYTLYFKSGKDWNPKRRQFSSDCAFSKFQQGFGKNQGWQVDLQPSTLGNAPTSGVDPY